MMKDWEWHQEDPLENPLLQQQCHVTGITTQLQQMKEHVHKWQRKGDWRTMITLQWNHEIDSYNSDTVDHSFHEAQT